MKPVIRAAFILLFIFAVTGMLALQMHTSRAQYLGGQDSISGRVYDANHNAIPGAKVTIYYTKFVVNSYVAADAIKSADNPQFTSNGSKSLTGFYQFSGLTQDVYIITAEKDGIAYSETVQLREGTKTVDIMIPGYIEKSYSASVTPTPKPSPTSSNVIPPVIVPEPDLGAIISSVARLALMTIVGLQFVAGMFIIALRIGQPK
ncbi:MAG TPA: carboxypeptidase-like regulatory domain-containing protein [Methanocella sp.]|uniref:carboxypeptidase-like regulatory domain-containing protein n=1 Tax=Methanocella sp. TaxID=2052833 RepID=UPI002C1CAECF|nr:carboxypeptidase-like regulatory domain-containing protein [Methanocella sp.]HTY90787.1 carboxypeptidase-like regulatory domain-containing protein [Methanocella sp.]